MYLVELVARIGITMSHHMDAASPSNRRYLIHTNGNTSVYIVSNIKFLNANYKTKYQSLNIQLKLQNLTYIIKV